MVGAMFMAAGLLFTTSAQTARGTQLRSERADLAGLIQDEQTRLAATQEQVAAQSEEITRDTTTLANDNETIRELQERSERLVGAAGARAVRGPALEVTLDDAPRHQPVPDGALPDDLVVHQQDVQAVVNALWAGGAEAMMLQDQRVISTSAVRCVGNTLILQGRVYSPPYKITAMGDVAELRQALESSPEVDYYMQYVAALNLGWKVRQLRDAKFPAYEGSIALTHARVPGQARPLGSTSPASTTPDGTPTGDR